MVSLLLYTIAIFYFILIGLRGFEIIPLSDTDWIRFTVCAFGFMILAELRERRVRGGA